MRSARRVGAEPAAGARPTRSADRRRRRCFRSLYLGLPTRRDGRGLRGLAERPRALFLLMLTVIVVSDTAQYYTGRAFGRRPLAPAISPKKTVEGAIGGLVFGTLAMLAGGRCGGSPSAALDARSCSAPRWSRSGIAGDLFESMLKRSAGVKDSSTLIPGHGGVLDRIDALLFAAPVYYMFCHADVAVTC